MSLELTWLDMTIRLACALATGALLGMNRGRHGRPAGLRTTMLVCSAACIAMLQANILLPMTGKAPTSFVNLDVMRLPLGILSGMGFIGAGAIVRRNNFVTGVTTASTLWFVTVLGLCFGGGQILLGIVGAVFGFIILAGLRRIEHRWLEESRGTLFIQGELQAVNESAVRQQLSEAGLKVKTVGVRYDMPTQSKQLRLDLRWRVGRAKVNPPETIAAFAALPGIRHVHWRPESN